MTTGRQGYALARAELIEALTAHTGITTADGAITRDTLIDAALIGSNDYVTEKTILIASGPANREDKASIAFNPATGQITVDSPFSAQIMAGTIYRILNISSVELDVVNILARMGTNIDPAGTTTLFAWFAKIFAALLSSSGLAYGGVVTAAVAGASFTIASLAGLGAGKFASTTQPPYRAYVLRDASGGIGGAPEGEMAAITGYTTASGLFTPNGPPGPFTVDIGINDEVLILHPRIAEILDILTNLGPDAAAATLDDLSDVTTTSAQAKLRRILLRMSGAGVFSADIQGAARTELDTMLAQLATYFVAAGAAFGPTVNNAAVASLAAAWSALNDMLVSGTGIANWLARALPANGVSLSEVVKYNAEVKPEWSAPATGTHTTTTATEETILTTGYTVPGLFYFDLDLVNLAAGDIFTIRVYKRIDGVNYRLKSEQAFPDAQRLMAYEIEGLYFDSGQNIRVTIQRNSATNRAFPYRYNVLRQPVA